MGIACVAESAAVHICMTLLTLDNVYRYRLNAIIVLFEYYSMHDEMHDEINASTMRTRNEKSTSDPYWNCLLS